MSDNTDTVRELSRIIGTLLEREYPAVDRGIPAEHADTISDEICLVVANILQAWLDAGSEREVTLEDLYGPINDHVKGWVNPDA
jgi:hypothetical protein